MILFVSLAGLLVIACLLFVAAPLMSRRGGRVDEQAVDAVAETRRQQLADLERELEDGEIDNRTYELSRREIESESSARQARAESTESVQTGWPISAIVMIIALPLATVALYLQVGNPEAIEGPAAQPQMDQMDQMDMAAAIETLEARLADQPDDLEGWMMLGRTRVALQEYDAAVEAFRQAVEIAGEDNPRVLANYAEAVTLRNPADMLTHAAPIFRRVLELDSEQPKGLWYSGLIAFEEGEYAQAKKHWQTLLQQDPPADFRRVIEDRLNAAEQALEGDQAGEQAMGGDVQPQGEGEGTSIQVRIELDEDLADQVSPEETVFLIARALDEQGAPLAGIRFTVSALPGPFRLGDENAMIDGHRLSGHRAVELVARVSRSGEATPQAGDLSGSVMVRLDELDDEAVSITIDSEL